MIFNNPNFQTVELDSVSETQRPSVQDIVEKYSNRQSQQQQIQQSPERGTFGNTYKIQSKTANQQLKIDDQNLSHILSDFSIVSAPEEYIQTGMNMLKSRVEQIIGNYNDMVKTSTNVDRKKLQEDVSQVALEYSMYSQMNKSNNEPELQGICNLVEEFLNKFQKQPNLELSVLKNIPSDESFYQSNDIPNDKLTKKLHAIQNQLIKELQSLDLPFTKHILSDMINNLQIIIDANDPQTIRTVIYKIEDKIQQAKTQEQSLIELYDYISKAMKVSQKKLNEQDNIEIKQIFDHMHHRNKGFTLQQANQLHFEYKQAKPRQDFQNYIKQL